MLRNIYLLFFLFIQMSGFSQKKDFPDNWLGTWKGTMEIQYSTGNYQEVACELYIEKTDTMDTWVWTIIYGEGETKQERKYELIAKDIEKGIYVIDEKNSIILDAFYANNTLISQFEVQNNLITSTYRKIDNIIYFQNLASNTKVSNKSGGEDTIPEVSSFPISSLQRAKLLRVE